MRWLAFPRWLVCGALASAWSLLSLAQAENPCGGFDYRGPLPGRSPWTVVLPCQMEPDEPESRPSAPAYQGCDCALGGDEPVAGPAGDPWLERHYRPYAPQVEPVQRFDLEQSARTWQPRHAEKPALEVQLGRHLRDQRHSYGQIVAELVNEEAEGLVSDVAAPVSAVASAYQPRLAWLVSLDAEWKRYEICPLARWRGEEIVDVCPARPAATLPAPTTDDEDESIDWEWSDECWGDEGELDAQPAIGASATNAAGSEFDGCAVDSPLEVCNPWSPPTVIVEEIAAHRPLMIPQPSDDPRRALEKYWRTQPLLVPEVIREDLDEETEAAALPQHGWSLREAILWLRVSAQTARESARLFDGMSRTFNALADQLPDAADATAESSGRAARRATVETR